MSGKAERQEYKMEQGIYLDHAATTCMDNEVLEAMRPYYAKEYGNPSAVYSPGTCSRQVVEQARRKIADCIGASPNEIYFTSGGTEGNNWALQGIMRYHEKAHLITTRIEHPSILNTVRALEQEGINVTYLQPDSMGYIHPAQVMEAVTEETAMVSIMYANNEIGTIQPIASIGRELKSRGILFHTDAVQAFGFEPLSMHQLPVDCLSMSGHKIYGPKGIGFLYIRKGTPIEPLLYGGGQERGMRSGTESLPLIVGLATAVVRLYKFQYRYVQHTRKLRDYLLRRLTTEIPQTEVYGGRRAQGRCMPNIANISFSGIDSALLLQKLNEAGVYASAGSACHSASGEPSYVLDAIGVEKQQARGAIRLSLGKENTIEEMERAVYCIKKSVAQMRSS